LKWCFNCKAPGDISIDPLIPQCHALISASCGNFIASTASQSALRHGTTTHVAAAGFVDLALLLDCKFEIGSNDDTEPINFYGHNQAHMQFAKLLTVWDLSHNGDLNEAPSKVMQFWCSAVWTKRMTNAFLAAAKRVLGAEECSSAAQLHPRVAVVV
jgi:hypothetical protein